MSDNQTKFRNCYVRAICERHAVSPAVADVVEMVMRDEHGVLDSLPATQFDREVRVILDNVSLLQSFGLVEVTA